MKSVDSLPDDILVKIFSYLSLVELIDNVRLTSCRWQSLSYDMYLWRVVRVRENERGRQGLRNAILEMSTSIEEFSIECPYQAYFDMIRKGKSRFTNMKRLRFLYPLSTEHDSKLRSLLKSYQRHTLNVVRKDNILLKHIMQFEDLRHLELRVNWRGYGDFCGTDTMSGFTNLNTLILKGNGIAMHAINAIYKGSPLLKKLTLECDDLTIRAFDDMQGNCNSLEKLSLNLSAYLNEDDLVYILGNSPNLLSLSLETSYYCNLTNRSIILIYESCKILQSLKINVSHLDVSDAEVNALCHHCPNLRKLHFKYIPDDEYANFSAVPEHCRKLEKLVLVLLPCSFTDESIILLSRQAANLRVLHLRESNCITGFAISQIVINCRRLKSLKVGCKNELDLNFDELYQKNTPFGRKSLTECDENCFRRDEHMVPFDHQTVEDQNHLCPVEHDIHLERRPVVSQVNVIWLYDTPVSNTSLIQIAKHCPDLVNLGVLKGDIYDDAAEALAKNCRRLRCLHLPGTKLTDVGLRAIQTFGLNLREIYINPRAPFQTIKINRIDSDPM